MAILMCQDGPEGILIKIIEHCCAEYEDPFGLIGHFRPQPSTLVNRQVRSVSDPYLAYRTRLDDVSDVAYKLPQGRSLSLGQSTAGILRLHPGKERLQHVIDCCSTD